jgi:succinate-semialdehyde dehydrogenase/glutarate-semialdehyde dehydrogenase
MASAATTQKNGVQRLTSLNPATGEVLACFETDSDEVIDAKLALANEEQSRWQYTSFEERSALFHKLSSLIEDRKETLARTLTLEMGKPIRSAVAELEKCATACRYYAENGRRFLQDEILDGPGDQNLVRYQPLGVVLAVMPWNFPFWQVFRFAVPALMVGNAGLLKHASNVPQCALAIEALFREAGFPRGVFQALMVGSVKMGPLIGDPRVAAITLTGSVQAGRSVASLAGKHLKKTVLELGGSDPFIVMESADVAKAAAVAVQARTINNGQSCIAAKRFIVHQPVVAKFRDLFVRAMANLKVGDPLDPSIDIGPLATKDVLDDLEAQVNTTLRQGARLLIGGRRLESPGFFYPPTVLAEIPPQSPAARDELFGPVASLFAAADLEDAVRLANDTPFGLGSSFWSAKPEEQQYFADRVQAGAAFINGMVASDSRLPFGGIKDSGYGRELGWHGLREFVNAKTVVVRQG